MYLFRGLSKRDRTQKSQIIRSFTRSIVMSKHSKNLKRAGEEPKGRQPRGIAISLSASLVKWPSNYALEGCLSRDGEVMTSFLGANLIP